MGSQSRARSARFQEAPPRVWRDAQPQRAGTLFRPHWNGEHVHRRARLLLRSTANGPSASGNRPRGKLLPSATAIRRDVVALLFGSFAARVGERIQTRCRLELSGAIFIAVAFG